LLFFMAKCIDCLYSGEVSSLVWLVWLLGFTVVG